MTASPANHISLRLRIASLSCGCVLAAGMIALLDRIHVSMLYTLSVGTVTTSTAQSDRKVLCTDLKSSSECLQGHQRWDGKTVLWLGNSQLPTINQQKPGDRTMVELLHDSMIKQGAYILGFAPPNANLQEHYVLFEYLKPRMRPDVLLLPVFFDDLREAGVRSQLQPVFDDEEVNSRLKDTEVGRLLIEQNLAISTSNSTVQSLPQSTMDQAEKRLNDWLESCLPFWKSRGDYRATFFWQMHYLRNTVFQIDPQSVRKMIPARYERNIAALHAILDSAEEQHMAVLMYIPPIRNDVPLPYDMAAYEQFKNKIKTLASERNLMFADFESVVASDEWGTKTSSSLGGEEELDFMHFAFAGHQKMAAALEEQLQACIEQQPGNTIRIISAAKEKVIQ